MSCSTAVPNKLDSEDLIVPSAAQQHADRPGGVDMASWAYVADITWRHSTAAQTFNGFGRASALMRHLSGWFKVSRKLLHVLKLHLQAPSLAGSRCCCWRCCICLSFAKQELICQMLPFYSVDETVECR